MFPYNRGELIQVSVPNLMISVIRGFIDTYRDSGQMFYLDKDEHLLVCQPEESWQESLLLRLKTQEMVRFITTSDGKTLYQAEMSGKSLRSVFGAGSGGGRRVNTVNLVSSALVIKRAFC